MQAGFLLVYTPAAVLSIFTHIQKGGATTITPVSKREKARDRIQKSFKAREEGGLTFLSCHTGLLGMSALFLDVLAANGEFLWLRTSTIVLRASDKSCKEVPLSPYSVEAAQKAPSKLKSETIRIYRIVLSPCSILEFLLSCQFCLVSIITYSGTPGVSLTSAIITVYIPLRYLHYAGFLEQLFKFYYLHCSQGVV